MVTSDLMMELFYLIEGEPSFDEIDYGPLRSGRSLEGSDGLHIADVERNDSLVSVMWTASTRDATADTKDVQQYGTYHLDLHRERIVNWKRIIPCIRRVSGYDTRSLQRRVIALAEGGELKTVGSLLEHMADQPGGLVMGAIATALRRRNLAADVDSKPWSQFTIISSAS